MAAPDKLRQVPPQLAFYEPEQINDAIERITLEEIYPTGFNPDHLYDPIRFYIRGTEQWIDWSKSHFYVQGTITGVVPTGGPNAGKKASQVPEEFALTNNFLHNPISSIEMRFNDTPVPAASSNYPYSAFIQSTFNHSMQSQHSLGSLSIYHMDDHKKMEGFSKHTYDATDGWKITTEGNSGAIQRFSYFANKDKNNVEGVIQLYIPVCKMIPYLISFTNVDITLNRNTRPAFYFMYKDETCPFEFKIETIKLKLCRVKINDSFLEGIENVLDKKGEPISYSLRDSRVFTKTYAGYGTEIIEDNLFHGILPSRVIFGFVNNNAFTGRFAQNPFKFEHLNIQEVSLMLNGQHYPLPPLFTDFEGGKTAEAFYLMMDSVHGIGSALPPLITHDMFKNGFTLFSFDMSSDQHGGMNHYHVSNQPANIRLHVKFKRGDGATNITLVVYYEVQSRISINKTRQVTVYSK